MAETGTAVVSRSVTTAIAAAMSAARDRRTRRSWTGVVAAISKVTGQQCNRCQENIKCPSAGGDDHAVPAALLRRVERLVGPAEQVRHGGVGVAAGDADADRDR